MKIATCLLVAVIFACIPSVGAAQVRLSGDTVVLSSPPIGELRNVGLIDVDLGREMVSRLACASDSEFAQYQRLYAAFVDSVGKVPAVDAAAQRKRDVRIINGVQALWKTWLEAHGSEPCAYKTSASTFGYAQAAQPSELSAKYHADNTLELTQHPAGRPFGPGFTTRAELLKQVADTSSAAYKRLESCVLKYSGLDTLQAQEYLGKLRDGKFVIRPAPTLIAWNASCGQAPGRNIRYVTEGVPATAAYVTLHDGLVIAALHSCSNVLTIPQFVQFEVTRERIPAKPVIAQAPPMQHARLVAYKLVGIEGQPGTLGDSVVVNVGDEVRFHLYARVEGDGSIGNIRVREVFWPAGLLLDADKLDKPAGFFEVLTGPNGIQGSSAGRPLGAGEVFNFDLVAQAVAPGRYVNIARFYSDSGDITDSAVVIVRGKLAPAEKKGGWYCSNHKVVCIGAVALAAVAIFWPRGHGHAAPATPTKPVGKPGTCTNSSICDRVPPIRP